MTNQVKKTIAEALKEIEANTGYITPHALMDYARSESSPIHKYFEWDNDRAAEAYRLDQARWYIREVRVTVKGQAMQQYWNATIEINDVPVQGYFSLEKVANNKQLYTQVLKTALAELKHWEEKYKQVEDLRGVVNTRAVEKVEAKVQAST